MSATAVFKAMHSRGEILRGFTEAEQNDQLSYMEEMVVTFTWVELEEFFPTGDVNVVTISPLIERVMMIMLEQLRDGVIVTNSIKVVLPPSPRGLFKRHQRRLRVELAVLLENFDMYASYHRDERLAVRFRLSRETVEQVRLPLILLGYETHPTGYGSGEYSEITI